MPSLASSRTGHLAGRAEATPRRRRAMAGRARQRCPRATPVPLDPLTTSAAPLRSPQPLWHPQPDPAPSLPSPHHRAVGRRAPPLAIKAPRAPSLLHTPPPLPSHTPHTRASPGGRALHHSHRAQARQCAAAPRKRSITARSCLSPSAFSLPLTRLTITP